MPTQKIKRREMILDDDKPANPRLFKRLKSYYRYHKDPRNHYTHFVGIPMAFVSLFMVLSWVRIGEHPLFGYAAYFGLTYYYFRIDKKLSAAFFFLFFPMLVLSFRYSYVSWGKSLGYFAFFTIVGWGLQFLGHYFEGKKPAFFDNPDQVLNAPLFWIVEIGMKLGLFKDIKQALEE